MASKVANRTGGGVMADYDLTYISLGAGVQSSSLLAMSATGYRGVPRADVAIFADTHQEPRSVYEHLWRLAEWSPIPVHIVSNGDLGLTDVVQGKMNRSFVPFFTNNAKGETAILRRKCTSEFKILPIYRHVRTLIGLRPYQRFHGRIRCLMGISSEEVYRMKPSRTPWIENCFPLVDLGLRRDALMTIFTEITSLPKPPRSACVFCPFHSSQEWRRLRDHEPEAWQRAVEFDKSLRVDGNYRNGNKYPVFLHRSLLPLDEAPIDGNTGQTDLWNNECEGMCGV